MDSGFKQKWEEYRSAFEGALAEYVGAMQIRPQVLSESVRYSLQLGGKRIRPVLMFACARALGGKTSDVAGFALALEMIHTSSLIHDDLPAMDNDDFRRRFTLIDNRLQRLRQQFFPFKMRNDRRNLKRHRPPQTPAPLRRGRRSAARLFRL